MGGIFAALRVPSFRILWIGTVLAFVGFFMSMTVQSVVAFDLTGANRAVGLVIFGQGLMMFTLGPLGGALADRLPKRRVIAIAQLATTSVYFAISWAIATGRIRLAWLVVGSMVMGASFAFLGPARQSLSVELVGPELRGNAIALTQVANSACRVLGPALGGALLAWFDRRLVDRVRRDGRLLFRVGPERRAAAEVAGAAARARRPRVRRHARRPALRPPARSAG